MNLKQLAGAVRRLLNPATGEEDTLKKEALNEAQARPRQAADVCHPGRNRPRENHCGGCQCPAVHP